MEDIVLPVADQSAVMECMSRCVVTKSSVRCERCLFPHRWCICDGFSTVDSPLDVHVLMHDMEALRPSSTGHLIARVMPSSRQHIFRCERPLVRSEMISSEKTLWILHPNGEAMPSDQDPSQVQVMLLDGNWRQAARMLHQVEGWGKRVKLPMNGESRYWLRSQMSEDRFSTVEALLFLLSALGLREQHDKLRIQFELHVFAGLCSRGFKAEALRYLESSPLREALPDVITKLTTNKVPSREERRAQRHRIQAPSNDLSTS